MFARAAAALHAQKPLTCQTAEVDLDDFHEFATSLAGVRRTSAGGAARWQFRGRLVARELDAAHVAVRVPFDVRDALLHQHPDVFSVPPRFAKHMIVVADLDAGDGDAVEDAVTSAWRLQAEHIDNGSGGQSDAR
jgi:hypothetical protein